MSIDSLPHLSGIYLITCIANGKTYVGSSQNIHKRGVSHRNALLANKHSNTHLQRAWNKYGADAFTIIVLELCVSSRLLDCEAEWFKRYPIGDDSRSFNISLTPGSPMKGLKHKADTLNKMAKSQSGRKHSDETKAKISNAHKGRKRTPEQIERLKTINLGRKASDETRRKLSIAHTNPSAEARYKMGNSTRGKKRTPESIAKYSKARSQEFIVTSPDGVEMRIKGLAKFCRENGLDQGTLSRAMRTNGKHKGWKCRRP